MMSGYVLTATHIGITYRREVSVVPPEDAAIVPLSNTYSGYEDPFIEECADYLKFPHQNVCGRLDHTSMLTHVVLPSNAARRESRI